MNLKLQYVKFVLVVLALLACFCFNAYTQSSTTIGNDTVVVTIKDENNNSVSLYLPESMNNDQCERRIYGTRAGVIGMFKTLYSEERRTESYEAAIRELCMQPGIFEENVYIKQLKEDLHEAGVTAEEAKIALDFVEIGAKSIKKNYIKGGKLLPDIRNKIASVGRKLNKIKKDSAFAETCRVIGGISKDIEATQQLTDIITGTMLLNSLATDNALLRLEEIDRVVKAEGKSEGKVDKALVNAIGEARTNILASQSKIGSFAVYVNDNLRDITDSAISLGVGLADMAGKISGPFAMWVGAPLATYNTLKGISNQWEMAQDAVTIATLTKMIEKNSQGHEDITGNITSYGQYAFYSQMEETFSVGGAKFHDFINIVGSANKDLSQYYRQGKQNTTIIAMKNSNSQEGTTQENENLTYSEELIAITFVIQELVDAFDNQDWEKIKRYCLPGSQAYLEYDKAQDTLKLTPGTKITTQLIINRINVNDFTAMVYCNITTTQTLDGKLQHKDNTDGIMFLEKVDNKWKMTKAQ